MQTSFAEETSQEIPSDRPTTSKGRVPRQRIRSFAADQDEAFEPEIAAAVRRSTSDDREDQEGRRSQDDEKFETASEGRTSRASISGDIDESIRDKIRQKFRSVVVK